MAYVPMQSVGTRKIEDVDNRKMFTVVPENATVSPVCISPQPFGCVGTASTSTHRTRITPLQNTSRRQTAPDRFHVSFCTPPDSTNVNTLKYREKRNEFPSF